jgi:hypothetical protein
MQDRQRLPVVVEAADLRPPESPRCLWYYRLEFEKIGDVVNKRQWFAGVEEADGRRVSRNSSIEFPR